jgi:cytochrome b involved in lipid metabolism
MGKGGKNSEVLTQTIDKKSTELENDKNSRKLLRIRIDNKWYDLTKWQNYHPGGKEILQHLNGKDATGM